MVGHYIKELKHENDYLIGNLVYAGKLMGLAGYGKIRNEWIEEFNKWYELPKNKDFPSCWYIPDFFLPSHETWLEIKGKYPSDLELSKLERLSLLTGYPTILAYGLPGIGDYGAKVYGSILKDQKKEDAYDCGEISFAEKTIAPQWFDGCLCNSTKYDGLFIYIYYLQRKNSSEKFQHDYWLHATPNKEYAGEKLQVISGSSIGIRMQRIRFH
jgi:hypothetical protein